MTDTTSTGNRRSPTDARPARMDALATLPVFLKLAGKRAVLVGGSEPALWKAELLAAAGADVDAYSETFFEEFAGLAANPPSGSVTLHTRVWRPEDLVGSAIAIAAMTDDAEAEEFVAAARAAGVPVNVIDRPEYCAFQFGAIVNRSPLIVSISTDGAAPVFAQSIRSRIEALLPAGFKRWAEAAKAWRQKANARGATMADRRWFWERFSELAVAEAQRPPVEADLDALLDAAAAERATRRGRGFVTLLGAGPGDPELLTLKGVRALRSADVVLYDDLVSEPIVEFARREARRVRVGKTGYGPACKQTEVNALMVRLASEGHRVVRLKSGDPMIFGRGGEEISELEASGIAFDVIPGVSAAQAGAARLKRSLTHRDHARRLQYVTGHSREGHLPESLDWAALADPNATTAVYMAQRTLTELSARVIAAGLPPDTPAFAMVDLTRESECVIAATIANLPAKLAATAISGPCLVMFGEALRTAAADRQEQSVAVVPETVP